MLVLRYDPSTKTSGLLSVPRDRLVALEWHQAVEIIERCEALLARHGKPVSSPFISQHAGTHRSGEKLTADDLAQAFTVYPSMSGSVEQKQFGAASKVQMQKEGVSIELKAYNNEGVATEDYRTGQCDGVIATAFRTRQFNAVAGSIDTLGATTIVRDGKIDMPGSYDVVRKLVQTYSSPQAAKLMVDGNHEVGGIVPIGAAYPIVNDRKLNTVESLAGKRIAVFDWDVTQASLVKQIGGQPVSADITNFAGKFNNGSVDIVGAPAAAFKPLELLHKQQQYRLLI